MPKAFPARVHHVQPQSPVTAPNTSRPTRELEAMVKYLKDRLDAIEAGRALVHYGQNIAPGVQVGQPVFWNSTTKRYERAQSGVENDTETGELVATEASDCTGLLLAKQRETVGDIILCGLVNFTSLAAAIDGDVEPGRYYLSAAEPGKLVRQRPPATVIVCHVYGVLTACETDIWVYVMPQMKDFLEDHVHHRFYLTCLPAGDVNGPEAEASGRHVITNADASLRGWLPADDVSFGGNAPEGAVFGYNLKAHQQLSNVWPPIPISAVEIIWDKGQAYVGGTDQDVQTRDRLVTLDNYGIWWMSNCYGDVPWPADLIVTTASESAASESAASQSAAECPRIEVMRVVLSFIRMTFATNKTVVTTLQPGVGQPFKFTDCDGVEAKVGDLFAYFIAEGLEVDEYYGGQVLKGVLDGFKYKRGWVAEGLIAANDKVKITSQRQRFLTPGDSSTAVVHQGICYIGFESDPIDSEISPQVTKLNDALEAEHKGSIYLALPRGQNSDLYMKFFVPPQGLPTTPRLKVRVQLFGRIAGTLPQLTLTYIRVPRATSPQPLSDVPVSLTFPNSIAVGLDEVHEIESEEFDVVPGDTIFVVLARAKTASPTYNGEVGVLRVGCIVVAGT